MAMDSAPPVYNPATSPRRCLQGCYAVPEPCTEPDCPLHDASGSPYPGEPGTPGEGGALPPVPVCTWCEVSPDNCPNHPREAPARSSSLDHTETSGNPSPVQAFLASTAAYQEPEIDPWTNPAVRFRHSGWKPIRDRIIAAMKRTAQTSSRISAFCNCGGATQLQRRPDRLGNMEYRIAGSCCHDRLCTPCANTRSNRLKLALMAMMKPKGMTFITLTLCGKGQGLGELVDRLYRHFKALRQHPTWSENVKGGAGFLEIKWSDKAQRWHPHLHIICEAKYIDQGELSTIWKTVSKDSYIVDIRRVNSQEQAAAYVTKYASKPLNTSFSNTPALLDEAMLALKGRRLALCFGTWYGTALDFDSDSLLDEGDEGAPDWENFMSLEELLQRVNDGDPFYNAILKMAGGECRWRMSLEAGP